MLALNFPAFENKKYTAYDRFHGNGPYGKIPTKKEPIRTLGFALPYNKYVYWSSHIGAFQPCKNNTNKLYYKSIYKNRLEHKNRIA